jgi:serine/threonine protein kinase
VHRDLKPRTCSSRSRKKRIEELLEVLAFGAANSGTSSSLPSTSTRAGALLGTPLYMSPEQTRGIKAVDHRSNVWCLVARRDRVRVPHGALAI